MLFPILMISLANAHALAQKVQCDQGGTLLGEDLLVPVSREASEQLSAHYKPQKLVSVPAEFVHKGSHQLRPEAQAALVKMFHEAREKSQIHFKIMSGFRDFRTQCSTYNSKFSKFSNQYKGEALNKYVQRISAEPGRSEHQLGTTVDIVYACLDHKLAYPDIKGRNCREYPWLLDNAHKFGFALSYPRPAKNTQEDFNETTGYNFEPWHWRFVGIKAAQEIYEISLKRGSRLSIKEYIQIKNEMESRNPSSASDDVEEIVIGMGGDVSLSTVGAQNLSNKGSDKGRFYTWEEMTQNLHSLTQENDFNFLNLESAVTDKNLISQGQKFHQKSHPEGVRFLVEQLGFNLISLANNHATDYGYEGLSDTMKHMISLAQKNKIYMSGIGTLPDVFEPTIIEYQNLKIAFSAIGMKGDGREKMGLPTEQKVGMISIRNSDDYKKLLSKLSEAEADLKILSVHEGTELSVHVNPALLPDPDQHETKNGQQRQRKEDRDLLKKFEQAKASGIDLIIGHHSHNVRPIDFKNNQLSIFGLGNFLFLGGQNYNKSFPFWNRFGLFAKAYYTKSKNDNRMILSAIQAIPLKDIHVQPKPWDSIESKKFIQFINDINIKNFGVDALQFKILKDGSGVFCNKDSQKGPKAIKICQEL